MSENQGITVQEFNIFALGGEAVSYHLKDIHTIALQVTLQNIGILSLEFEVELNYTNEGAPFINVWVARGSAENPERDRSITFRPEDWIVILWDEIHKFRDPEFKATFSFDGLSAPAVEFVEKDAAKEIKDALERPEWIPNDAIPMVDTTSGNLAWLKPDVYDDLSDDVKKLYRPYEKDSERTQIVASVGELDTDETNGKLEGSYEGPLRQLPENPHNTQGIDTP